MIKRYTRLALFKSKNAPQAPNSKDYYYEMIANVDGGEKDDKAFAAKFWLKQSEAGLMYFSGETKKPYTNEAGATFEGYVIVSTRELDLLEKVASQAIEKNAPPKIDYGEPADLSDIPF